MDNKIKNPESPVTGHIREYGFQRPIIKIEDHIFGADNFGTVLNESGQHDNFLPKYEPQSENFETQGCTVWGTENAIEILYKEKFGEEKNYEELPPYIGAGVTPDNGGDPNKVSQWIRDNGLVEHPQCPFPTTRNELKESIPVKVIIDGQKWRQQFDFRHKWVLEGNTTKENRINAIKEALKYGVLGVSVTAWFQNNEGVYVDNGMRNTHWCVCYGWTDKGWKIFDSYDHSNKIYSFDSEISYAKIYFLEKKVNENKVWYVDIFQKILTALTDILKLDLKILETVPKVEVKPVEVPVIAPETPKITLGDVAKQYIGKDISKTQNEYGCAESVSFILHKVYPDFPENVLSTIELFKLLKSRKDLFTPSLECLPNSVIISPTAGTEIGHTGIVVEKNRIISNDSKTSLMKDNYSFENWVNFYKTGKKLHVYIFNAKVV